MEELQSILPFLATFPSVSITSNENKDTITEQDLAANLHNGVVLFDAFSDIAPSYFDASTITRDPKDNYVLKQSNWRKLLRNLRAFVREELHKKIHFTIDSQQLISAITKHQHFESVRFMIELVAATAVTCTQRAIFVGGIRELSPSHQVALKLLIQRGLAHLEEECEDSEETEIEQIDDFTIDLKEADTTTGLISNASSHRLRKLSGDYSLDAESDWADSFDGRSSPFDTLLNTQEREEYSSTSKLSLFRLKNQFILQLEDLKKEYTNLKTQSESFYENSDYTQKKLRANADDLQDRLTKREQELETAEENLSKTKRALEDAESKVDDLTEKCHLLADELDVANAKASQLLRAEATVAVYRKRLEGLGAMGQQIADLEDQNAKYLQQIVELEGESKKVFDLNKTVDELQRDLTKAEKEKAEALHSLNDKVSIIQTLKANLSAEENAKRMYESALKELRSQQEQEETLDSELGRPTTVRSPMESRAVPTEIMNRLKTLELENSTMRLRLEEEEKEERQRKSHATTISSAAASSSSSSHDIQSLYQEINDLHELLDHKDEEIQKMMSDREKLENYTKSTLAKFQDKYLAALNECKTKLKEKHEKILDLELKMDTEIATHKREEKLMSSAVYELGLAIMQAKLKERY